jgi:hypothetical protein
VHTTGREKIDCSNRLRDVAALFHHYLFVAFSFYVGFAQDARIVFYNVENLFDCEDDPKVNDNEFLPRSMRRWTITKYREKLIRQPRLF